MKRELDFKKGDKVAVAIEPSSNASRGVNMSVSNIDNWVFEGVVTASGRKYITVDFKYGNMKFVKEDDLRSKYTYGGADYKLYASKEDIYETFKAQELYDSVKRKLNPHKNSYDLATLEKVYELLNNK